MFICIMARVKTSVFFRGRIVITITKHRIPIFKYFKIILIEQSQYMSGFIMIGYARKSPVK